MTQDFKLDDKVVWYTSEYCPRAIATVKKLTPERVKIEVVWDDGHISSHYVKKENLIKVDDPGPYESVASVQPTNLHLDDDKQIDDSENIRDLNRINKDNMKYTLKLIALCVFLLIFFVVWPIYEIQAGCPDRTRFGAPHALNCSLASVVYPISIVIGVIVAGSFIQQRIKQGKWLLLKPGYQPKDTSSKVSYNIISAGRYLGLAIIGLLFMISPILGTSIIFVGAGFLAGGATAFLARGIIDFVSLFPKSIAVRSENQ